VSRTPSKSERARYVVGIDLGTTHTVVAYAMHDVRRTRTAPEPSVFPIPQHVSLRDREPRPLLASSLYAPLPGELDTDAPWVVGEFAKRRSGEITGRVVTSAKSWLSHPSVDRTAPILPWGGSDESLLKLSPVEASARILQHVASAWDLAHPEAPLASQDVVLTLPASFDDVARQLTLRAASDAGLMPVLLEEPTAAFYDAMRDVDAVRAHVVPRSPSDERTVLVCDVGGGTTDLSLMAIAYAPKDKGGFSVRRVAVGRHILLGGDNMDLALAHLAEARISESGGPLDPSELSQLVASCRDAKERVLSELSGRSAREHDLSEVTVTVLGRGNRLVGGARRATLSREDIERVVVGGFFPSEVTSDAVRSRSGVVAFGLPYERDPAITRHIRQFLERHAKDVPRGAPDVVLLNGGVFNAPRIVDAVKAALRSWYGREPSVLPVSSPDLAVACGAVRFGFARTGLGVNVESGAAHGYYVSVEEGAGQKRAVCILPRGAKEGVRYEATERWFDLLVGKTVRFEVYASDLARDEVGALVTLDEDAFERLPPVVTHLEKRGSEDRVRVRLGGELRTTGQLELACVEPSQGEDEGRKFRLEFSLREPNVTTQASLPSSLAPRASTEASSRLMHPRLEDAERILDPVFGKKSEASPREVKDVLRDLERVLGDRQGWSMPVCRHIVDRLLVNPGARRRSAQHERAFWWLLGFGLRPGFGDPGDPARIERVYPLAEGRLGFPDEPQAWPQFFIAWRRIAGGLTEPMQIALRDAFDPLVAPKEAGLKLPKRAIDDGGEAFVMLAALERVPASRRAQLGDWLLEKTWTSDDARLWTSIARVGARVPVYASVHHVVAPKHAEAWLERLLRSRWESVVSLQHASVQLARFTGDRARDVSERLRAEVEKKLVANHAKPEWIQALREVADLSDAERVAILGEGLPIGLTLAG
jgi:molecular chaperone DnaK (HSP70)